MTGFVGSHSQNDYELPDPDTQALEEGVQPGDQQPENDRIKRFLKTQTGPIVWALFVTAPLYLRWIYEATR